MNNIINKNNIRIIVSVALAFVTCIFLFIAVITASVIYSFDKSRVVASVKDSGYTEYALAELTDTLNDLAIPSGLPTTFFNDKVDAAQFEKSFYECLNNNLDPSDNFAIDTSVFEAEVLKSVTEYSVELSGGLSSESQETLKSFSHECAEIYLTYINPVILSYVFPLLKTISKYLLWVSVVAFMLWIVGVLVLFKVNTPKDFRKYLFISLVGSFLTCSVIPAFLLITNEISRISISLKSLYAVITGYLTVILSNMLIFALPLVAIAIILLFFQIRCLIFKK